MEERFHLIIVTGLPGTGKSTFAKALATNVKAVHLNTDKIRDEKGLRGKYDPETKSSIYHDMLSRARQELKAKQNVIIDATFSSNGWRSQFYELANEFTCIMSWIVMQADEGIIRKRVAKKRQYSEADFSVYKKVRSSYDPLLYSHLVLNSDQLSIDEMIEKAMNYLNRSHNYN